MAQRGSSATLPRPTTTASAIARLAGRPQFKECHSTPNATAIPVPSQSSPLSQQQSASGVQDIPQYVPVYQHKTAIRVDSLKSDSDSTTSKLFQVVTTTTEEVISAFPVLPLSRGTTTGCPDGNEGNSAPIVVQSAIIDADLQASTIAKPSDVFAGELPTEGEEVDESSDNDNDEEEFEYTDEDLDEALQTDDCESAAIMTGAGIPDNLDLIPCEGHYMPMTPKRLISRENSGVFSPDSDDARLTPINLPSTTVGSSTSIGLTMMTTTTEENEEDENGDGHFEENHYVEMTQGKMFSVLSDDYNKSNYETICIPPSHTPKREDDVNQEPVYMELSHSNSSVLKPVTNNSKLHQNPANLPDILNPTQSLPPPTQDTSDDDVERERVDEIRASNLVARAMKPKTRFSLSDTFRPASYYLGPTTNSKNQQECADSSDSEIVSPPPIPKSPPPIEELRGSGEAFQMDNVDTIKRKKSGDLLNQSFEGIPKFSASDLALHKAAEGHKTSRLSLPDQLYHSKYGHGGKRKLDLAPTDYISLSTYSVENKTYTASVTSCNTDDGSNTSSDYDLYNKLKLESPSFMSESVYNSNRSLPIPGHSRTASEASEAPSQQPQLELRHSDSETERRNKRRPLSEDSISELELDADSHTFDEAAGHNHLDQYLGKLSQPSYNYTESSDQNNWIHESLAKIGEIHYIKPPEVFRTDNDSFYENLTMIAKQQLATALPQEQPSDQTTTISNADDAAAVVYDVVPNQKVVTLREKNLSLHNAQLESEDRKSGFNLNHMPMASEVDQQSVNCTAPLHSRGNSNVSDGSAPYYYSDLCRATDGQMMATSTAAEEAKLLLNNQRDVVEKRKHGISHIHNPLQEASYIAKPSSSLIDTRNLYENEGGSATKLDAKGMHKESAVASLTRMKPKMKNDAINEAHSPAKCVNVTVTNNSLTSPSTPHQQQLHHHLANQPHHNSGNNFHHAGSASSVGTTGSSPVPHLVKTNNNSVAGIRQRRCSPGVNLLAGVENVLYNTTNPSHLQSPDQTSVDTAGDQLWEEDALWRDRLRRVSHQHARSMDDLDRIGSPAASHSRMPSTTNDEEDASFGTPTMAVAGKSPVRISRGVKYVNEDTKSNSLRRKVYRKRASSKSRSPSLRNSQADSDEESDVHGMGEAQGGGGPQMDQAHHDDNDVYVQLARNGSAGDLYETLLMEDLRTKKTLEMDREKIRQWDFMSSGVSPKKQNAGRRSLEAQGRAREHVGRFSADHASGAVVVERSTTTENKAVVMMGGVGNTSTTTRTRGMTTTKGYSSGGGHIPSSGCGNRQSK